MAARQGLQLMKAHRRDPNAWDFGTYQLVDPYTNSLVAAVWELGRGYGLDLDDVEKFLTERKD